MLQISVIAQSNEDGKIYDLSQVSKDVKWETTLEAQPGKLTFSYLKNSVKLPEGSIVTVSVNGKDLFYGYVFKKSRTSKEFVDVVAYDQLRYLKNKDTFVRQSETLGSFTKKIAVDLGLTFKDKAKSSFVLPAKVLDNKSYFEMIQDGIDTILINSGEWLCVRDDFGTICLDRIADLRTNLFIGENSLLSDYKFETSIDDDTYNYVRLTQEDKEAKKRNVYIVKDSSTMAKWGKLQYYESVDEKLNPAQIQEKAELLIQAKNRVTKSASLDCIGNLDIFAGCGIILNLGSITEDEPAAYGYYIVTKCTHSFNQGSHKMSLDIKVV